MRFSRPTTVAILLILLLVTRLVPPMLVKTFDSGFHMIGLRYLWNLTPLWGACLFCGAMFRNRTLAFAIPLAAQVLGDMFYWQISGDFWQGFGMVQSLNYILIGASVLVGMSLPRVPALSRLVGTGVAVAVGQWVISNFAVWGLTSWYPHDLKGLSECFAMALPFFPTTVAGTLLYGYGLFALLGPDESHTLADNPASV